MLKKICFLTAISLLFAAPVLAQSAPSATSGRVALSVGAEGSNFNSDWGCASASEFSCWQNHLWGIAGVFDADHVFLGKLGVEGEARWLHWGGPGGGLVQSNYLIGPRYQIVRFHGLKGYAKGLFGGSWMTLPSHLGNGSYFTIAPGATVEIGITKKLVIRGDYEYQEWPAFSGIQGVPNNGLTPNGLSAGIKYRLVN